MTSRTMTKVDGKIREMIISSLKKSRLARLKYIKPKLYYIPDSNKNVGSYIMAIIYFKYFSGILHN